MAVTDTLHRPVLDPVAGLVDCSPGVGLAWEAVGGLVAEGVLDCGLLAGDRPTADVAVLLAAASRVEAVLGMRLAAAEHAEAVALPRPGDLAVLARWAPRRARALSRAGELANTHSQLAGLWLAGVITTEHVHAAAVGTRGMTAHQVQVVVDTLAPVLPQLSPADVSTVCAKARALLNPPDPEGPDPVVAAFQARHLDYAISGDVVHIAGLPPRLEGELLIDTLRATAQAQRAQGDGLTAGQRRADALTTLCTGRPSPGTVHVTVSITGAAHTASGWPLSPAETAHLPCSAVFTPILVHLLDDALATPIPLAMGRAVRTATPAQRRALALRDQGCVIPGCDISAAACQTHHITPWAEGGTTDMSNMALLCWPHHRQVDLGRWTLHPPTNTQPVTLTIKQGNHWLVCGPSGAVNRPATLLV